MSFVCSGSLALLFLLALPFTSGASDPQKPEPSFGNLPLSGLIKRLKEADDPNERAIAARALGAIGPAAKDAVPTLVAALKDDEARGVRRAAAEALGEIGPGAAAAVPELVAAFKEDINKNWPVQLAAAHSLGKIGPGAKAAVPDLLAYLNRDTAERIEAVDSGRRSSQEDRPRGREEGRRALTDLLHVRSFTPRWCRQS